MPDRAGSASGKRYVVIGSNCFTGSHIVDALLEEPGNSVVGISRSPEYTPMFLPYKRWQNPSFRFVRADLVREYDRVLAVVDEVQPHVVFNVAALSEVELSFRCPVEYYEVNTLAVVRLCNDLRERSYLQRYVHISSAEVYGSCAQPVGEDAPHRPSTPYAASKSAADMFINTLVKHIGFPAMLIRSTNVYGRHQQLYKIIPRTVIYLRMGKPIDLHGGGRAVKSFVHVRDVVRGMMLALSHGRPGTYHFSVSSEDTVADVVRQICELMGRDFGEATRVVDDRLAQDSRYWLDCTRSEQELGWRPEVSFQQGIGEVIEWIERNWDEVLQTPLYYQHKA